MLLKHACRVRNSGQEQKFNWRIMSLVSLATGMLIMLLTLLTGCDNAIPLEPEVRAENEIWIESSGFEPEELVVTTGTTVVWVNKDTARHAIQSVTIEIINGEPTCKPSLGFSPSGLLAPDESFPVLFAVPGTFEYCWELLDRSGRVVVQ